MALIKALALSCLWAAAAAVLNQTVPGFSPGCDEDCVTLQMAYKISQDASGGQESILIEKPGLSIGSNSKSIMQSCFR